MPARSPFEKGWTLGRYAANDLRPLFEAGRIPETKAVAAQATPDRPRATTDAGARPRTGGAAAPLHGPQAKPGARGLTKTGNTRRAMPRRSGEPGRPPPIRTWARSGGLRPNAIRNRSEIDPNGMRTQSSVGVRTESERDPNRVCGPRLGNRIMPGPSVTDGGGGGLALLPGGAWRRWVGAERVLSKRGWLAPLAGLPLHRGPSSMQGERGQKTAATKQTAKQGHHHTPHPAPPRPLRPRTGARDGPHGDRLSGPHIPRSRVPETRRVVR